MGGLFCLELLVAADAEAFADAVNLAFRFVLATMKTMTRRALLSSLGLAPLAAEDPCPVQILVEAGPTVEVVIPSVSKRDVVAVVANFFADAAPGRKVQQDRERTVGQLGDVINYAKDVTLTITTRCPKPSGKAGKQ